MKKQYLKIFYLSIFIIFFGFVSIANSNAQSDQNNFVPQGMGIDGTLKIIKEATKEEKSVEQEAKKTVLPLESQEVKSMQETKIQEDLEAKRKAEEAQRKAELETKKKAEEARIQAELEAKKKAEEERKKKEAEVKRKAEEVKRKKEAEVKRKAEAEKKRIEEERRQKEEQERIAKEKRLQAQKELAIFEKNLANRLEKRKSEREQEFEQQKKEVTRNIFTLICSILILLVIVILFLTRRKDGIMNFQNLKIKNKLLLVCIPIIVIPILVLGMTSYLNAKKAVFQLIQEKLEFQVAGYRNMISENYKFAEDDAQKAKIIASFKKKLKSEKVGKTGYMYVIDSKGMTIMHPKLEGKSIAKHGFIQEIMKKKEGYTRYEWEGREKVVAYTYFEPLDWIIGSGSYLEDFTGELNVIGGSIVIVGIISIVVGIFVVFWFSGTITVPIAKAVAHMQKMADCDFSADIAKMSRTALKRKDEMGLIARAISNISDRVGEMITEVKASANQLASATEEISSSAQQISDGAQQQSANFSALKNSVRENSERVDEADRLSQAVTRNAEKADSAMNNTIEAMNSMQKSSNQIAEAVNLITDIADQTNLLALNAAIEAARAGEHGKGFAVVADEVRQLAERSASSAKDIETLIRASVKDVDDGVSISKEAGESLKMIMGDIKKVAESLEKVSNASKEQSTSMDESSSITESNAAGSEELAATAEEMAGQAEALQRLVERFKSREKTS